ncbi:interleukin-1 beta-like [Colossoma macropomum]|uniref:interleukin-1 beta-like n=1 Tax=Colossoma macropomum TaxID=42526 RepID=UPI001864579B|nr:interleukin-1 beta-like [Colossoma macropomum]XP_036450757.1 interleukin-1 beta-like [Colossoma macropomum]
MADKDLLLLESFFNSTFESDEMDFDELDCSDPLAMSGRCALHKGLQIEITKQPHSMRQVANFIIALNKFKHTQKVRSTEFTDNELFNIILESVIEESVVTTVHCESLKTYNKHDRVIQCTVCDSLKKSLVRFQGGRTLLAVTLKGGNSSQSVSINLSSYTTPRCGATNGLPVCLGIAQSDLYLACTNVSGTPSLNLEVVEDKEALKTIYENDDMERFLFLRKDTAKSNNTFESVKYPGWFISTSKNEYTSVDMCVERDTSRQKVFSLHNQKVI